jgi:hypothetical protein
MAATGMVLFEYPPLLTKASTWMKDAERFGSLGFLLKVLVLSAMLSIAIKTLPWLRYIPATAIASLVLVLTPVLVMTAVLTWHLWKTPYADPANPGRD